MKSLLSFSILLSLFYACSKNESPNQASETQPDYALRVGSWWIYENFNYDTINGYTPLGFDTVMCTKDSMINGSTFFELSHTNAIARGASTTYLRVHEGKLLNINDGIAHQLIDYIDTIQHTSFDSTDVTYISTPGWHEITLNQTRYTCLQNQTVVRNINNRPYNACDSIVYLNNYFADGVGNLISQFASSSDLKNCAFYENRLLFHQE